jgi:hypothetical protein
LYEPPLGLTVAVNTPVCPLQIVIGFTAIVGIGFTVTVTVAVFVQLFPVPTPDTVYVVVAAGDAVGLAIEALLKLAEGNQV